MHSAVRCLRNSSKLLRTEASFRLLRPFSSKSLRASKLPLPSRAQVLDKPKSPEAKEEKLRTSMLFKQYDSETSGDYMTLLNLEPLKADYYAKSIGGILEPHTEADLFKSIMQKLKLLFSIRIINDDFASLATHENLPTLESKIPQLQKERMKVEFDSFVNLLMQATITTPEKKLHRLLAELSLMKINSHTLWRSIIPRICENIDSLSPLETKVFVSVLCNIMLRYHVVEGQQMQHQSFLNLDEYLLMEYLNSRQLGQIINHLIKLLKVFSKRDSLLVGNKACMIVHKFIKFDAMSNSVKFMYLDQLGLTAYEYLMEIKDQPDQFASDSKLLQKLISSIIILGRENKVVLEALKLIHRRTPSIPVTEIARIYSQVGVLDKEFWSQKVQELIADFDDTQKSLSDEMMVHVSSLVARQKMNKPELVRSMLNRMIFEYSDIKAFNRMHPLKKKNIHLNIVMMLIQGMVPEDMLQEFSKVANYFAGYCICLRHKRKFEKEVPEKISKGLYFKTQHSDNYGYIDCIKSKESEKAVLKENKAEGEGTKQYFEDNYVEHFAQDAIKTYVLNSFKNKVNITFEFDDIQVCMYRWDGVLNIQGVPQKIGLEITGRGYKANNQSLLQKKEMKLEIMGLQGYIPFLFDMSEVEKTMMLKRSKSQHLAGIFIFELIDLIKSKTGIELKLKDGVEKEYIQLLGRRPVTKFSKEAQSSVSTSNEATSK